MKRMWLLTFILSSLLLFGCNSIQSDPTISTYKELAQSFVDSGDYISAIKTLEQGIASTGSSDLKAMLYDIQNAVNKETQGEGSVAETQDESDVEEIQGEGSAAETQDESDVEEIQGEGSAAETQDEDNTPEISSSDVSDEILTENSSPEQSSESSVSYEITDSRARTWTNRIGSVWVQTIIEIKNTGTTNLYLSSGSYDLEDASGKLVASQKRVSAFPNVLTPGEKGYMYEETTLDEAVDGELTVLPHEDVEEATVDLIRFPVTDVEISNDTYGSVKMLGRIENTSDEEESMIYIVAFLYDANGSCIGRMFTILSEDLAAGDKIGFEMSGFSLPDDITTETIADFVIYAYPRQYQF